ncbi:MAG: pectinesterase family protein [Bacteroidota bacterium]
MKFSCVIFIISCGIVNAQHHYDVVVAKDGSGDVRSIQDALKKVPVSREGDFIIFIKNAVYNEKIFITQSNIVFVGEHRDSTKIVFAELRKHWNASLSGSDWGSAVVNIDSTANDITFMNVTVYNNYGSLSGNRDHQFALWGKGTRIILYNCAVISDGGDALSLWNATEGMYYHAQCYFEGWVDFVCPRGWCFITGSKFYGHNTTASLWHDGSSDPDQKFVITNSYFDGVKNFPLGRHHRDGQFILLNCTFSENLADSAIHYPSYSPNARRWKWGRRHYYFQCKREGGNYRWFTDNFDEYPDGTLTAAAVTPQWVFRKKWDPVKRLEAIFDRLQ